MALSALKNIRRAHHRPAHALCAAGPDRQPCAPDFRPRRQRRRAGRHHQPGAWAYEAELNAHKTLNAGFTTVRNLGDGPEGITLALRDAINKGWVQGPRIIDAGTPISATAGHMDGRLGYS
jgi:imidazolonepropionase-like amidohydrolase